MYHVTWLIHNLDFRRPSIVARAALIQFSDLAGDDRTPGITRRAFNGISGKPRT
jgi:hypothetical protein